MNSTGFWEGDGEGRTQIQLLMLAGLQPVKSHERKGDFSPAWFLMLDFGFLQRTGFSNPKSLEQTEVDDRKT